ncbi:hypothetical protein Ccrd_018869 [Cynara cardunculus var. scolymus]|uniref:Uncharacterized protein n=1 Tax=Cynara cardunculus var. scolymus TaxID=59895 RepID=A0A103Y5F2_CYNCS|nr:hypothetical protein Ccrd_018869 [Cynara cardunculus var. scolymus]
MFTTIRSVSVQAKPVAGSWIFTVSENFAGKVSPTIGNVRSHQASASPGSGPAITNQTKPTNMEKIQHSQEPTTKGRDVMSHTFGDAYSTRSDEQGFGGAFTGNESLSSTEQDKIVNANAPDEEVPQSLLKSLLRHNKRLLQENRDLTVEISVLRSKLANKKTKMFCEREPTVKGLLENCRIRFL